MPHTIENEDFVFNAVYVRALRNKDEATSIFSPAPRDSLLPDPRAFGDYA